MSTPRVAPMEQYEQEMKGYKCLFCQHDNPEGADFMEIVSYPHDYGHAVLRQTEFGEIMERRWFYGVCKTCKYQWALWKLRDAYTKEW